MKATTAKFKQIMASGDSRVYQCTINMTLADSTTLTITEADIWEDSFSIETASSGTSSFDIGTAVIGQCKFTINNYDGDFDGYDFFNATATVWLGLVGDESGSPATQQYYRMGFYTVDEPQISSGLISLTLLDNMWKFDRPFSGVTINYPATARTIVQTICTYCGVTLSGTSQQFHGYNFSIAEAPKDVANMNCREMLQYIAMIGCNFCIINDSGNLEIKWYDVNATSSTTDVFELNQSTAFGTEDIEITGVKFVIDDTAHTIGSSGYVLELDNPLVNASNVNSVLNLIWDVLENFTLRTFSITTASDLAVEVGDKVKIKDYKGDYIYSWVNLNTFRTAGHQVQCNAQAPNRNLVTRYSKTVQAAVEEARKAAGEEISNYDLAVQMMNDLAVNAMGGFEDYEDLSTGGRVWYLSNMPITKTGNVCSFQPNSTVYKRSGSGFFVSRDGGTTWVNGYNTQTGELVVNVLDAIGINFDWARGGTLTLGGYGNGNGILSILNSSNVEKVHGDNTGIKVGSTTGSKMHLTTSGEIDYYYDNAYGGRIRMDAVNYGTQEEPDLRDTFLIDEFNDIEIISDNSKAYLHLSTDSEEDTGNIQIETEDGDISLTAYDHTGEHEFIESTLIVSGEGIHLNGGAIYVSGNQGYDGTQGYPVYVDPQFYTHELEFTNGIVTGFDHNYTSHEVPNCQWHSWQSGGTTYVAIILGVGVTQAIFPDLDSDDSISYEPHIKCASGQSAPKITDMVRTGNSITVTFTAVTQAQAGSGATSECVIKLLRIKG